jgi:hypothetical protein
MPQYGLKINNAYTWRDLEGDVSLKVGGAGQPILDELFVGSTFQVPFFGANDVASFAFHMPHDWVVGSDLYCHVHWCHNGTAISGSLVNQFEFSYSKGHNQENFPSPITVTQTILTPDIATVPRYRHRIDEFQLSAASPTVNQIDTDLLEVDGLILCSIKTTTIPTITGGTPNEPAILFVDIHYLSSNIGTINKAPNFYA